MGNVRFCHDVLTRYVKEFSRYVVVGGLAFVVDFFVLWLSKEFFLPGWNGVELYIATALGFCTGFLCNYSLGLWFVFTHPNDQGKGRSFPDFVLFLLIAVTGLLLTEVGMFFGVERLNIHYLSVKLFVTGGVLIWNYLARRLFIFSNFRGLCNHRDHTGHKG